MGGSSCERTSGEGGEGIAYGIVSKDDVYGGGFWKKMLATVAIPEEYLRKVKPR